MSDATTVDDFAPPVDSTTNWNHEAALLTASATSEVPSPIYAYGSSVSLDGQAGLVGAAGADPNGVVDAGAVYVIHNHNGEWAQTHILTAPDGANSDLLGQDETSVSLCGVGTDAGAIAVGGAVGADVGTAADAGKAYVWAHTQSSEVGGTWTLQATLQDPTPVAEDYFGTSVSVSYSDQRGGYYIVVGAYRNDDAGTNAGAAFVYVQQDSAWPLLQTLTSPTVTNAYFGDTVSLSGDWLAVAAAQDTVDESVEAGAVYVYQLTGASSESAGSFVYQTRLTASDYVASARFGRSISLDGDTLLVGAYWANPPSLTGLDPLTKAGQAYVFVRNVPVKGETNTWQQTAILAAPLSRFPDDLQRNAGYEFGRGVSLDGATAVVGCGEASPNGLADAGMAYVYQALGGQTAGTWVNTNTLIASDAQAGVNFADSLSVSGNNILIGAWLQDVGGVANAGQVYIFGGSVYTASTACTGSCVVSIVIPLIVCLALLAGMAYWFKTSQKDYQKVADQPPVAVAAPEVQTATPAMGSPLLEEKEAPKEVSTAVAPVVEPASAEAVEVVEGAVEAPPAKDVPPPQI